MENFPSNITDKRTVSYAPPIKCVRADCDSQHEKKIKRHFLLMPAILAAQQPPIGNQILECKIDEIEPDDKDRGIH